MAQRKSPGKCYQDREKLSLILHKKERKVSQITKYIVILHKKYDYKSDKIRNKKRKRLLKMKLTIFWWISIMKPSNGWGATFIEKKDKM